jgi:hypothetical protein
MNEIKPVVLKRKPGQSQSKAEKEWVNLVMTGYDWKNSRALKYLNEKIPVSLNKEDLVSIGKVLAETLGIRLYREYKRRMGTMVRWIDENFSGVHDLIDSRVEFVCACDE